LSKQKESNRENQDHDIIIGHRIYQILLHI